MPNRKIKILIAEHDKNDLEIMEYELAKGGIRFESKCVQNESDYMNALVHFIPDIILSDYSFPAFDGPTAFKIREELAPNTPFIFVSGTIGEEKAVEEIKRGVTDYTSKNTLYALCYKIERALKDARSGKEKEFTDKLLIENEKRFRALIENSTDLVTLTDKEGKFIYSSPSITREFGYSKEEFFHKSVFSFFHPEDVPYLMEKRKSILETPGSSFSFIYRLAHKNGSWKWCEGTLTNLLEEPSVQGLLANFRDISERIEAERQRIFEENNLNALINNTNDLMWSVDRNFNLITSNKPFDEMGKTNFGRSILKGENVLAVSHTPEMLKHFTQLYERAFSGEIFTEIEHFKIPFEFWTEISYYPIRKGDEIIGTACYSRDITQAKLTERKLLRSESFNKGVLNSLSSHIAVIDFSGNIVAVNESWNKFALENGETTLERTGVGSNYFRACEKAIKEGDEIASDALRGMKYVIAKKNFDFYLEYPCHSPDKQRWFSMRAMKFNSDEPMIVVAHQSISERKLAEKNLIDSESKLREAQAIAHIGNWEIDFLTNKAIWSDEACRIYGLLPEEKEHTYESWRSFIHSEDKDSVMAVNAESLKTLSDTVLNHRIVLKDGSIKYIYAKSKFKLDGNGKPIGLYGISQDVTEFKLAEKEREKMVSDIIQRSKNLEQFTYIISHNLRAPIVNILGLANILKADISGNDRERTQDFLFSAIEKLDDITKDLNKILQTKSEITESKELVDFEGLVNAIKLSLENMIYKEKVRITTDFSAIKKIKVVKSYIYSIFYNLILNSIKYRQESKEVVISIRTETNKEHVWITFKDNGLGINLKEHGDKVFGLYKRFHPHIEGKGLGLFMVRTQVEVLGGKISVKSEPGVGTEFTIELPYENGESSKIKEV